ncbi:MAG TPA: glutathione S-transferase family protein [Allosphingosinicella sp.]|nr:glutathione S-transferase family protein [Allosphingosinicella sp.]
MRKLYYDPASTVCRPLSMFLAEHDLGVEMCPVDLRRGEQRSEWFARVNPNMAVPAFEEDGFVLTESAAILRYFAQLADSPAYPADLRARARIDEALDWFNTGFYRDHGYGLVYPEVLPHYRVPEARRAELRAWHTARVEARLHVLDAHMIGDHGTWATGEDFSIADMFGAALVTLGDLIGYDLSPYPNVCRWLAAVQARPSWGLANQAFHGWQDMLAPRALAA